ncbi:hypothetical protein F4Z98_05970 [Candidatus Poribacteria bacterium]|nr:hypothetical protein [Candidatus Poribacteria bacterium]MYB01774.1 hypothetical protein [Candidatus Poribacteria bacterium]
MFKILFKCFSVLIRETIRWNQKPLGSAEVLILLWRILIFGFFVTHSLDLLNLRQAPSRYVGNIQRLMFCFTQTVDFSNFFVREFAFPRATPALFFSLCLDFGRQQLRRSGNNERENSDTTTTAKRLPPREYRRISLSTSATVFFSTHALIFRCISGSL